ncbi:MAG: DUF6383 domain-containing protein [Clostridium sp.]|nr:DUF6383 domain-containing protein [Clostridium sp.]
MKPFYSLLAALVAGSISVSAALPEHTPRPVANRIPARGIFESRIPGAGISAEGPGAAVVLKRQTSCDALARRSALRAPKRRVTAGGTELYGYLGGSDDYDALLGLYEITSTPTNQLVWSDPVYDNNGPSMSAGWFYDGKVCGFSPLIWGGYIYGLDYVEIDFKTGEQIVDKEMDLSGDELYMMSVGCYNASDGYVYGYGIHADLESQQYCFMKAPVTDPENLSVVISLGDSPLGSCLSMTYNEADQKMYGVNSDGNLVTIDSQGAQTVLFQVDNGEMAPYYSGLAYSAAEKRFFWQLCREDYSSSLIEIDPAAKTATKICDYENGEQYMFFIAVNEISAGNAPEKASLYTASFANGSRSGMFLYLLPSKLTDGTSLSSTKDMLDWEFKIDGVTERSGQDRPGSFVTIQLTDVPNGLHAFSLTSSYDGVPSLPLTTTMFIGNDTPSAPTGVTVDTEGNVSWNAVTTGVNGGWLDLSKMSYSVRIYGEEVISTTKTSCRVDLPTDRDPAPLAVEVVAVCNGLESLPGASNTIVVGRALTPDVSFDLAGPDRLLFTIIDANDDEQTWTYNETYGIPAFTTGWSDIEMDEWLILPAIEFASADRYYEFHCAMRGMSPSYPDEYFELRLGKTPVPSAMTTVLIEKSNPPMFGAFADLDHLFKVPEAGVYYIALRCVSAPEQYALLAGDFRVSDTGATDASPAAVTSLTATAAGSGKLQATVSFRMPETTISGDKLPADATLTAVVEANGTKSATAAPGENVTLTVNTYQGTSTIAVSTTLGTLKGLTAKTAVYCGVDAPGKATNLAAKVSDDMMSATLTWDAPAVGDNGGYIIPGEVRYNIHKMNNQTEQWSVIAEGVTGTSWVYSVAKGAPQEYTRLGVESVNEAGEAYSIPTVYLTVGTPYTLPVFEDFDGPAKFDPFILSAPTSQYNASWQFVDGNTLYGDGSTDQALVGYVPGYASVPTFGRIAMPAVSTVGCHNVELSMIYYAGSFCPTVRIFVQTPEMDEPELLTNLSKSDNWVKSMIAIPEDLMGYKWVKFFVDAWYTSTSQQLIIEEIEIKEADPTSIDSVDSASLRQIASGEGVVTLLGYDATSFSVSTPDGRTAASGVVEGDSFDIALPAGIYIVTAGGDTAKLIVR